MRHASLSLVFLLLKIATNHTIIESEIVIKIHYDEIQFCSNIFTWINLFEIFRILVLIDRNNNSKEFYRK